MTDIRSRLAGVLRESYYRIINSSTDVRVNPGEVLADAVLAFPGIAVVELPDVSTLFVTEPGLWSICNDRQVTMAVGRDKPFSPDDLQTFAAALLAVAVQAQKG